MPRRCAADSDLSNGVYGRPERYARRREQPGRTPLVEVGLAEPPVPGLLLGKQLEAPGTSAPGAAQRKQDLAHVERVADVRQRQRRILRRHGIIKIVLSVALRAVAAAAQRSFRDATCAGESNGGTSLQRVPAAFALRDLEDAVGLRRGIPSGQEGDVLDERRVEDADGATRGRKVRERVDVRRSDAE